MPAPVSNPKISTSVPLSSVAAAAARSSASRPLPPATPNSSAAILGMPRARATCAACRTGHRYWGRLCIPFATHQAYRAEVWVGSHFSGRGTGLGPGFLVVRNSGIPGLARLPAPRPPAAYRVGDDRRRDGPRARLEPLAQRRGRPSLLGPELLA